MRVRVIATSSDCPGDDCPTLMVDEATGDVFVQGYTLTAEQRAATIDAAGPLPTRDGVELVEDRLRIPGSVLDDLIAQRRG